MTSPVPVDVREAAKGPLLLALHDLNVRIAGLRPDEPDLCHCGLVAEVALDAVLAAVDPVIRRQALTEAADNLEAVITSPDLMVAEKFRSALLWAATRIRTMPDRPAAIARSHSQYTEEENR